MLTVYAQKQNFVVIKSGLSSRSEDMNYPNLINENLSKNLFEYDGGDLWIK